MRMGRFSWPKISWKRKRKQAQVQGRKGSQRTLGHRAKEAERRLRGARSTPGQALSLQAQEGPLVLLSTRMECSGALVIVAIESDK